MEKLSLQRIYNRLNEYKKYKEDIQLNTNSMLYNLINNNGEIDSNLIPHFKEFSAYKKIWKRLPVHIDRTITNVFKTLTYDIKTRDDIYAELKALLEANVLAISNENEAYNRTFAQYNMEDDLENPNAMGIYNDEGELIDVVDRAEYQEYLEEYQNDVKNDYLRKYAYFKQIQGDSFIDMVLKKQIKEEVTEEDLTLKDLSPQQRHYISKEKRQENKIWNNLYKRKTTQYICKRCGEPVFLNQYHVCDIPLKDSKLSKIFTTLDYIHFHEKREIQELTNETIHLPETTIPTYKEEILKMNNVTRNFDVFNQFRIHE